LAVCLAVALSVGVAAAAPGRDHAGASYHDAAFADAGTSEMRSFRFDDAFAATPHQPTHTFLVKNCNDSGTDSLREAVNAANTLGGDNAIEFDLNSMQCSTISLTTGEIKITTDNLTIGGPGPEIVTIDGGYRQGHANRIFDHTGNGTLQLDHLQLSDAKYGTAGNLQANGGCVYSSGTVYLTHTNVNACYAVTTGAAQANGGALWGNGVKLNDSVVTNSTVMAFLAAADGGGIATDLLGLRAKDSTISRNVAISYSANFSAQGGGALIKGPAIFERSTISGNQADFGAGLLNAQPMALANSTVANNIATRGYGGLEVHAALSLYNSTVVFNEANEYGRVAGIHADSVYAVSSLLARNTTVAGGTVTPADVESSDGQVSGFSNFIMAAATGTMLPMDTRGGCPRLAPLLDNGGATRTVALLPASPAIDVGDDPFTLGTDQRGAGFPRVVGPHADIGAYEWSVTSGDVINQSGFEVCE
jgi:hypothetical protein